jgi:hypothetical protein
MNQQGLELMRAQADVDAAEVTALQHLIAERRCGAFVKAEEGKVRTRAMIARRSAAHGVSG